MTQNIAIVGATGAVGKEILQILEERKFPLKTLRCFASHRSVGKTISFRNETIALELLDKKINEVDLAFFCAGSKISKEWIPKTKCLVVDSSSAFRDQFPLVIPEINEDALKQNPRVVSSPNCAATILLMPLFPLHKLYAIKRIIVSTYQAASGGGAHLLNELQKETQAQIENRPYAHALPFPYAFNLFPHNSALDASGYVEEEIKIKNEVRKILDDFSIQVSATCVRVPVFRAHSLSANVEFHHRVSLSATYEAWHKMPGLKVFEDRTTNRFATPCDVTGKDEIFVGRLRIDTTQPNTLEFWAVGDQLRKGAALNAVQLGEALFKAKTGFTG